MNICMVVYAHFPHDEVRVQREAQFLIKKGHNVDVICASKNEEPKAGVYNKINFYRIKASKKYKNFLFYTMNYLWFALLGAIKLNFLYTKKHYKIIQIHNPPDILVFIAILPKILGSKIILDIHDPMPEFLSTKLNIKINHPIIKIISFMEKVSCKFANQIITVNHLCKQKIEYRNKKNCLVVMNLPDKKFTPIHYTKNTNEFSLIYHGTLSYRFGVDIAIRAIQIILSKIPEIKFYIIGEGDELPNLIKLSNSLSLADKIIFNKKFLPVDELPEIIKKMDVGIVPTRSSYLTDLALNTKILEYVAMGKPCIVSNLLCIKYYFNEKMLLFFTPGDERSLAEKICYAYDNKYKLKQFVKEAKKFFIKYNWDNQNYIDI